MLKISILTLILIYFSGCSNATQNMKDVGGSLSNAGAPGLLLGSIIYGTASLVEKSTSTKEPETIAVAN